jgi:adenosylmethionine-8-amino-7-oxononanoate aminotransferase
VSHVFHRSTRAVPPVAAASSGITITDAAGKSYIDASGGAAVSCLGHGHERVVRALQEQAAQLAYAHTGFFTSTPAEALADRLIENAPAGIERVYFVSGGSEGVEAALKLARQYFVEIGQPGRHRFISRRQSYHGNTLGALAVGGNMWRRAPYDPLLMKVSLISPCFAYHFKGDDETEEQYGARVAGELENEIQLLGPETVAAFIAETVVGATAGAVTAVPGYFKRIREICDRYGVLLILDEVMCGMGRTGTLFACAQEGIAPDIAVIAKGLGGGYQPIGAMLASGKIYEAIAHGSGTFMHGHTYMGHPMACAAGLAVLDTIREERLLDNVKAMGARLRERLGARFGNHPQVGDVRGRGLFQAIEIVADRATKRPIDAARQIHARIKSEAMARGLMVYPMGGTIDGRSGDHVLVAPPYIVTATEIDTIVERLGDAVDAALGTTN